MDRGIARAPTRDLGLGSLFGAYFVLRCSSYRSDEAEAIVIAAS